MVARDGMNIISIFPILSVKDIASSLLFLRRALKYGCAVYCKKNKCTHFLNLSDLLIYPCTCPTLKNYTHLPIEIAC